MVLDWFKGLKERDQFKIFTLGFILSFFIMLLVLPIVVSIMNESFNVDNDLGVKDLIHRTVKVFKEFTVINYVLYVSWFLILTLVNVFFSYSLKDVNPSKIENSVYVTLNLLICFSIIILLFRNLGVLSIYNQESLVASEALENLMRLNASGIILISSIYMLVTTIDTVILMVKRQIKINYKG